LNQAAPSHLFSSIHYFSLLLFRPPPILETDMTLLHLQKTGGPYGEKNHPQRIGCNDRDVCLHSIQSPKSKYRNIREHTPTNCRGGPSQPLSIWEAKSAGRAAENRGIFGTGCLQSILCPSLARCRRYR